MDNSTFVELMKKIQSDLLNFLDFEDGTEEHYQNLLSLLNDQQIPNDRNNFDTFIRLIINISNDHNRLPNFFNKIERILLNYKEEIKQNYSNVELFLLFYKNKRLLLFLIQEKMMIINQIICDLMINEKYSGMNYENYFQPELKPFLKGKKCQNPLIEKLPDDFEEKRKIGENESYISELIRNDSIDQFISHVNQNSIPVNSIIDISIYETNYMLLSGESSLIEYAAFFGSVQIFKYLLLNGAEAGTSIWLFAIHGNSPELIKIIEEKSEKLSQHSYLSEDLDNIEFEKKKKIKKDQNYDDEEEEEEEEEDIYDDIVEYNGFGDNVFANSSDIEFNDYDPVSNDCHLTYKKCLKEAIKCHHNGVANYIIDNFMNQKVIQYNNDNSFSRSVNAFSFFYSNFSFFPENLNQKFIFFYACRYNYYTIVKNLLKNKDINLQMTIIIKSLIFINDVYFV